MQHQAIQLDAVLFMQRQRAFQHGVLHDGQNFRIVDGLINIFPALVAAQIRAGRVAHVVDVQLALNIKIKRLKRNHVRDLRNFTLERGLVNRQETVALDTDAHRIAVLHLLGLHGHHAANGGLDQTDLFIKVLLFLVGQQVLQHPFHDLVCVHQVFADDDVERAVVPCPALSETRDDVADDELENSRADRRRHDIAVCDGLGGRFLIVAVDRGHVLDHDVLMSFAGHIADGILLLFLQRLHDRLCHVDECDLIAGLTERCADEAAANVAAAVHNCLFHTLTSFFIFRKAHRASKPRPLFSRRPTR